MPRVEALGPSLPPSAPAPPKPPAWEGLRPLYSLEGRPPDDRARAHAANVRIREGDADRYASYLERFLEGARRCRTAEELRAYGRPAIPTADHPPGATQAEDDALDFAHRRAFRAYERECRERSGLMAHLEGRAAPLEVTVEAQVSAALASGGRRVGGFDASLEGDGMCMSATAGRGTSTARATSKSDRIEVAPAISTPVGAATLGRNGKLDRLEVTPMPGQAVGPYLATTGESVSVGLKGGSRIERGGLEASLQAKLGLRLQLLDAETVRLALTDWYAAKR
jgi:hypothetical protein